MSEIVIPPLPFGVRDWLTDGKVRALSPSMRGWWMDLIAWTWFKGEDRHKVPKDLTRVAEYLHVTVKKVGDIIAALQNGRYGPLMEEHEDHYVIKRLRREKKKLDVKSDKARQSAHQRWKTLPQEVHKLTEMLFVSAKENTPRESPFLNDDKKIEKWKAKTALAIDKLHRLDKVSYGLIAKVIEWIRYDKPQANGWTGWGSVIQSGDKLREKFPTLINRMKTARVINGEEKIQWPEHLR